MEETTGYEALFSSDEWDSLDIAEWTEGDDFDPDGSPSGVTPNGEGNAAQSQTVASEGCISHSIGPSLDTRAATSCDREQEDQDLEAACIHLEFVHEVSCRTRELLDGSTEYVLECEICEEIGTADDYEEADVIAQQHKMLTTETWGT